MPQEPGVRPLPRNPNCVSFAAEASDVLEGRGWREVQELGAAVLRTFHQASELPAVLGFGWRVALDRKNQRHTQVTMFFVFDGAATSEHIDALDAAAAISPVAWNQACVERVPDHGVPVLYAFDGVLHRLLVPDPDGRPTARRLELVDGKVRPVVQPADEVPATEQITELPAVVGEPAAFGPEEEHVERMRLAFAHHHSQRIVQADGVVQEAEEQFMRLVFAEDLMRRLAITDPAVQEEYLAAAREELPTRLGHHDKLGLVGLFFSACYSDGSLDSREMRVLREAGEELGLTREQVVKYLRRFW